VQTLVFDVGGTKIRAGLFDPAQSVLLRSTCAATPNHLDFPAASFDELRGRLVALMHRMGNDLAAGPVNAVNVAFAGPVDPHGNVLAAPTIWGDLQTYPLRLDRELGRGWPHARIACLNDVTAAGYRYRRTRDDEFCIVTVSSGIGNKVFAGGRPLLGKAGAGGELGHLRVDDSPDAPLCECGGRGHLGAVASGRGVLDRARAIRGALLTSQELAFAFRHGEVWATSVIERGAAPLGWALAAVHLAIGIERFVLVGGFALALGDGYRKLVASAAQSRTWNGSGDWLARVELGVDDDLSGLIGAGLADTFPADILSPGTFSPDTFSGANA
jgi:glucokinase